MLFDAPPLEDQDQEVLARLDGLRDRLRHQVAERRRWHGSLRRVQLGRAVRGSNSIEGYVVSLDDAVDAVDGEDSLDAEDETRLAVLGYRDALTYVLQVADDPTLTIDRNLIRSLHFLMLKHDLGARPGRWRAGPIYVHDERTDEIVYEGPSVAALDGLMSSYADGLEDPGAPREVRAAMAHLNLVMIHPFRDGNGRTARAVQTLVLTREGLLAPEFCSIEEYLGGDTDAYYRVLAAVGDGRWQPERSAQPFVRYCLTAHFRQANRLLRRVAEAGRLWEQLEVLARRHVLPDRVVAPLWSAAKGLRLRNASYRREADVTEQVASRELRLLVERGLLVAHGEKRGRTYSAGDELRDVAARAREQRSDDEHADPYRQPTLL